jgi:AraC-like DNA-binding protein
MYMLTHTPILLEPTEETSPYVFGFSEHRNLREAVFDIHYELEVGVVLQGVMHRFWENTQRILHAGDIWMTNVWEPHGFRLAEVPCKVAVFLLRPELLASLHLGIGPATDWFHLFSLPPQARPTLSLPFRRILRQQLEFMALNTDGDVAPPGGHETLSYLVLLQLLAHLRTNLKGNIRFETGTITTIQPALQLVFKSHQNVSEQDGARVCRMSPSTFRRKFKQTMGVTFARFALHHRLKSAALALQGPLSIDEVAREFGFFDTSHFYRVFKKVFKKTPVAYRTHLANLSTAEDRDARER